MALVFKVNGGGSASLPNVTITDELDSINPPNAWLVGLDSALYMRNGTNRDGVGFGLDWDSDGEIITVHNSYTQNILSTTTTLSSGAEKLIFSSTITLKEPDGTATVYGGGTISNVKGFVMLSVGSLTDAQVVAALNNESGISGVQSDQVMREGDGWWIFNPYHNPGIDDFAIVYLLSSQVS